MQWFFEVTTVGPIWTPVLRIGILTMVIHQLILVLLLILHRERTSVWWISTK
jgi:hypothetical protein